MARTKKSNYTGTPYQKKNDRIKILEDGVKLAINFLDNGEVKEAKIALIHVWMKETNL